MLAWTRVGIALLTIGYSLDRLGVLEVARHVAAVNPYRAYAIAAACTGTLLPAGAVFRYLRQRHAIEGAGLRTNLFADIAMMSLVGVGGVVLIIVVASVR